MMPDTNLDVQDHFMNDPPLTENSELATLIEGFKATWRAFEISCEMTIEGDDAYIPPANALYPEIQKLHTDLSDGTANILEAIISYTCKDANDVALKSRFLLRYLEAGVGIKEEQYDKILKSFTCAT